MKNQREKFLIIDYGDPRVHQFVVDHISYVEDQKNQHKVYPHDILDILPDRIGEHKISPYEKITLLMDDACWTSENVYLEIQDGGCLTIAESPNAPIRPVKVNECYFEPTSAEPNKTILRFVDGIIDADKIPDKIRGITVTEHHKNELILNGKTSLFGDALYVNIAYGQYLTWTEKFNERLNKPFDYQCATVADVSYGPRHEQEYKVDESDVLKLYFDQTPFAERLKIIVDGLSGEQNNYISIMGLTKFIPDVVYNNPVDMMTKINLLAFGEAKFGNGHLLTINIDSDGLIYSKPHETKENTFVDYIVEKKNCLFELEKKSLEIPAFLFPIHDETYKNVKEMYVQKGKAFVYKDLLDKFPDVINGHHLTDLEKTHILMNNTSRDLNNHKIQLDPNFGILYYASRTFTKYGVPEYQNRVIKLEDCQYEPMKRQMRQQKAPYQSPKKDKGNEMSF